MTNNRTHVEIDNLPALLGQQAGDIIRRTLRGLGYARKDVAVDPRERVSVQTAGGAGYRGFAVLLNLLTGETVRHEGSWGGANMFNPANVVDLDSREHQLPEHGAVILGSDGAGGVRASVVVHPSRMPAQLPGAEELSSKEQRILYAYGALKSGPYRQEELRRAGASREDVDSMVARGYLSKNRGGAVQITTRGKNARRS